MFTLYRWAVIKNEAVFERMTRHIGVASIGVSRDSQLRALKLLKVVLEGEGREIFEFGYETMKTRWEKLIKALAFSKRFSPQEIEPQYCTFFHRLRELSPGNSSPSKFHSNPESSKFKQVRTQKPFSHLLFT